jgi:chromosomal replication initiator protein
VVENLWEILAVLSGTLPGGPVLSNVWEQIKEKLTETLSPDAYQNWVQRTELERFADHQLLVRVPDEFTAQWIRQKYESHVLRAITELHLPVTKVEYHVNGNGHNGHTPASRGDGGPTVPSSAPTFTEPEFENSVSWLNPRLTFDTYVVGSSNQFAHAAALAVATTPSRSYNPLFIYGGVGVGKTHLMHAIGWSLMKSFGGLNVVYTSSERFMNEMISCIKLDRMPQFHRHYRSADVLLIDDIHILAGKERTQEEFFHTFNDLYDHRKQIVISSDSAPNQVSGLVERLRSRFEWGLMVDIQPPDLETKMAILDKKAETEGIRLPEDVRIFIATKTKTNVRELEGSLTRLMAVASLTGQPITLAMAQQTLKYLISAPEKKISMDAIIRKVAEHFNLTPTQIKLKSNTRQIAYPRQIAMYLIKQLTSASLPEIGRVFGGKHHTTVLHSVQKIEQLRRTDEDLNRLIQSLTDSLRTV